MEQLFRLSDLETRIPLNMNVLDGGLVPKVMSLQRGAAWPSSPIAAKCWSGAPAIACRKSRRGSKCWKAISLVYLNLDKVIKIIRTEDEPKPKLMKAFSLSRGAGRRDSQHAAALPAQA